MVQVDNEVLGTGRCKITFGVDGKVRVVAFVGEERRDNDSRARSIVVGKFRERKEREPVVLQNIRRYCSSV